ncbi:MAG: hypothetical protein L3J77_00010 [Thermoplasmata archaeon]|nr:hypothetical protein [Thermoplasmata archaeon]
MTDELPDPEADQAAWARLDHRLEVERRARKRSWFRRVDPEGSGPKGSPIPLAEPDLSDLPPDLPAAEPVGPVLPVVGVFPNHEALAYATRSAAGAAPFLILVGLVGAVLIELVLIGDGSLVFLVLLGFLVAALVVVGTWGARLVRARTPTAVEFGSSGITATWGPSRPRRVTIPFERITSIEERQWQWMGGRANYAVFHPASLWFEADGAYPAPKRAGARSGPSVVYLTDQNGERASRALQAWNVTVGAPSRADAPSRYLGVAPGWRRRER